MTSIPATERPSQDEAYFPKTFGFNLNRVKPALIEDICVATVLQYVAGLIVTPTLVVMSEHSVAVQPGSQNILGVNGARMPASLIFRETFQAEIPAVGREFWLVTVQVLDPGDGEVSAASTIAPAQFYVYNTAGWTHIFDFEHRHAPKRERFEFRPELDNCMDFPEPKQVG